MLSLLVQVGAVAVHFYSFNLSCVIVMCGKQLINIWLAFRILGLEMNFDNFISVTCICVGML